MNNNTFKTRNLTVRYVIALSLIALLSISTYVAIRIMLFQQTTDAPVINLAGRQRMLSQKLTKEVLLFVQEKNVEEQEQYRQLITTTLANWKKVHEGLQKGDKELNLPGNNSQDIQKLFDKMNPYYHTMVNSVEHLLELDIAHRMQFPSQVSSLTEEIVNTSPLYLQWMDKAVFQYDHEAQKRVDSLKDYEALIVFTMLFVLLLEARFIFRPMVNKIRDNYQSLKRQSNELSRELINHKKTGEELRKLSLAVEQSPSMVIITDLDAHIEYVNSSFTDITGYTKEEVIGKNPKLLKSDKTPQEYYEKMWATISAGHEWRGEVLNRKKDGEFYWARNIISPIKDEAGEISHYLCQQEDITAFKQLELEREQENEALRRYENIVSTSDDFMGFTDRDYIYRAVNDACLNYFGKTRDEIVGRHMSEVLGKDHFETVSKPHLDRCLTGEHCSYETWFDFPMRGRRCIDVHYAPYVDKDGAVTGFVFNGRDITERIEVDKLLRRSQKMEAIGQLTGGIAHDFNNLLNIFRGSFELLQEIDIKDEEFQHWIETGLKATQRGTSLTKRLLGFSKADAIDTEIISVNAMLVDMEVLLAKSLTAKVTVGLNLGENMWFTNINKDEFADAVVNLAVNARDAMPKGGSLRIETTNELLDEEYARLNPGVEPGEYVLVSVSDTGSGIEEKVLERVFEPFFTTKETGKGTGLGLSMVYGFIKRSNGHIKIYSEPGHGTTVRMYLPRSAGMRTERHERQAAEEVLPGGTELVLLVDDETDILNLTKHQLETLGYQVLTAGNGHEALEVLERHKEEVALLFSDVVMPGGMDGYALAEEAVKREPDLKVLLASGFTNNIIEENGQSRFHVELLSKPYTKMELANKVRNALDNS